MKIKIIIILIIFIITNIIIIIIIIIIITIIIFIVSWLLHAPCHDWLIAVALAASVAAAAEGLVH